MAALIEDTLSVRDDFELQHDRLVREEIETFRRKANAFLAGEIDRKSTRLNSSHRWISYAVFCLKKTARSGGPAYPGIPSALEADERRPPGGLLFLKRRGPPQRLPLPHQEPLPS